MLVQRRGAHPAASGLESDDAAGGGRDAQGSSAVGPHGDGDHARGHGDGGAAGRAARGARGVPGGEARAVQGGLRRGELAELGHVRASDDDGPGGAQPLHDGAVGVRRGGVAPAAQGRHLAGDVVLLLDGHGHAGQGPGEGRSRPVDLLGLAQCGPPAHDGERVDVRVDGGDARQRVLHGPSGAHPAPPDRAGDLDGAGGGAVHGDLLGRGRRESPASLPAGARAATRSTSTRCGRRC